MQQRVSIFSFYNVKSTNTWLISTLQFVRHQGLMRMLLVKYKPVQHVGAQNRLH